MKIDSRAFLAFLLLFAMWFAYFEFTYWFIAIICFGASWGFGHIFSFTAAMLIIALTAGSQTK